MLVEVDVDNRNGELLPGAYAQVHFALGAGAAPFTLPGNALLFRPDGVTVATVDAQHKVKLMPVSLGTDFGTRVAIASGLKGDEQVILNPQDSIVDGAPVRIVARKAEGAAGASGASGAAAKGEGGVSSSGAAVSGEKSTGALGLAESRERIASAFGITTSIGETAGVSGPVTNGRQSADASWATTAPINAPAPHIAALPSARRSS
jgi:hypothetical protein